MSASNTPLALIPPRVAFLDPRTGDISRQWFLLIAAIVDRLGGTAGLSTDDLALGSLSGSAAPGLEEALQRLTDALGSNPSVVPTFAEPTVVDLEPTRISFAPTDDVSPIVYVGSLGQQESNRVNITGGTVGATTMTVSGNVGFYGTAAAAKPTVAGSRGANAALASLLTGLASLGLVNDTTTV